MVNISFRVFGQKKTVNLKDSMLLVLRYAHNDNKVSWIETYIFNNSLYIKSIHPVFINKKVITTVISIIGR